MRSHFITELEGLRGVAITAVLLFHLQPSVFPGGFIGVDVFFVLSGFLITCLLRREFQATGKVCFRRFYWNRLLRLTPPLAFVVFVTLALSFALWRVTGIGFGINPWKAGLVAMAYLTNWVHAFHPDFHVMGFLGHTWSLSIEEQYYLLWPVVFVFFISRCRPWSGVIASLCLAFVSCGWRVWLASDSAVTDVRLFNGLDTRAEALLIGGAVSLAASAVGSAGRASLPLKLSGAASAALLVILVVTIPDGRMFYKLWATVTAVAAGLVILTSAIGVTAAPVGAILNSGGLRWLGRVSYSLYLMHMIPFGLVRFSDIALLDNCVKLISAVLSGYCAYRLIEVPIQDYRRRTQGASTLKVSTAETAPGVATA